MYIYMYYVGKVYIFIYVHKGRTISITDVVWIITKGAILLANDPKVVADVFRPLRTYQGC